MRALLRRCGYDYAMELPLGAVIGVVRCVGCVFTDDANQDTFDASDPAVEFGLLRPGKWVWVCVDAAVLPQPVPLRGKLGLFKISSSLLAGVASSYAPERHEIPQFDPTTRVCANRRRGVPGGAQSG
jgi:hypothetical protein